LDRTAEGVERLVHHHLRGDDLLDRQVDEGPLAATPRGVERRHRAVGPVQAGAVERLAEPRLQRLVVDRAADLHDPAGRLKDQVGPLPPGVRSLVPEVGDGKDDEGGVELTQAIDPDPPLLQSPGTEGGDDDVRLRDGRQHPVATRVGGEVGGDTLLVPVQVLE
jgi:hypothetical protein